MPTSRDSYTDTRSDDDIIVVRIFESLRDRIVHGDLVPGSLINSVEQAQQFGTSRTPVREALLILSQHGLVNLSARRRPRVAEVSTQAIRDLYALRIALHHFIAEAVVENATDAALDDLLDAAHSLLADFETTDTAAHLQAVEQYLALEASLAGNARVQEVLESMKWRIAWYRRLGGFSRDALRTAATDRIRVAQAYKDRDTLLAQALNRSMLRKAVATCEKGFLEIGSPHIHALSLLRMIERE